MKSQFANSHTDTETLKHAIIRRAEELGFDLVRFTSASPFPETRNVLEERIDRGSWILLGELLLDVELPPDEPVRTHCGACTRCMPACPTGALIAPGVLDNNRCISYLTIELRGPIPREMRPLMGDWVFGCDICQEVCPVNRKAQPGNHPEFAASQGIGPSPSLIELLGMGEAEFKERYRKSPVKRA